MDGSRLGTARLCTGGGCCSAHAEEGPRASLTAGLRPRACLLLLLRIELRRFTADRREQASNEPGDAAAGVAVVQGGSSRRRGFECAMSMVGCRRSSQRESSPSSSCRRRSRRASGQVVRPPPGARERAWRHLPAGAPSDGRELAARVQVVVPAQRCRASEAPLDAVCPAAFGSRDAARQSPDEGQLRAPRAARLDWPRETPPQSPLWTRRGSCPLRRRACPRSRPA